MTETLVVISDLHANAGALRAALAAARAGPLDQLVILGDLLTYGVEVTATLDLVAEAQHRGAVLLLGNHDQLYLDLAAGARDYYAGLPAWLRESVDHTLARLDVAGFQTGLAWRREYAVGETLFAHANPYPYGDWAYVNSAADHAAAATRLAARGYRVGVFGHTHRCKLFVQRDADGTGALAEAGGAIDAATLATARLVLNTGSLGQPRDAGRAARFLRLQRDARGLTAEFVPVAYDVAAHLRAVRAAGLSAATTARLCAFFEGDPAAGP